MLKMRQPFFSIASGGIYMLIGLGCAYLGRVPQSITILDYAIPQAILFVTTGLMFSMAYFSLIHMKFR